MVSSEFQQGGVSWGPGARLVPGKQSTLPTPWNARNDRNPPCVSPPQGHASGSRCQECLLFLSHLCPGSREAHVCGHTHVHTHRRSKNSAVNSIFKHSVLFRGKTTPPPTRPHPRQKTKTVPPFSGSAGIFGASLRGQARARG